VKHVLQNTQNDCQQWLSDSYKLHPIRFGPGIYSAPPDPPAGLMGPIQREGREKGKGGREGEKGKGERGKKEGRRGKVKGGDGIRQ